MNRIAHSMACLTACVLASAVASTGCQNESSSSSVVAPPGPKERLELILATINRGFDNGAGGVITSGATGEGGSYTAISASNRVVNHELIPPANDGESYRATITIESRSRYSYRPTPSGADENSGRSDDTTGRRSNSLFSDDPLSMGDGGGVLDSELIGLSSSTRTNRGGTPSSRVDTPTGWTEADTRTYELVYKNDRWELITKLDEATEKVIQLAFDHALARQ